MMARTQLLRADLAHAIFEHGHRIPPADPFRDHRRRHGRPLRQQQPKLVFHRIGKSDARASLTPRNLISAQRRPNSVPAIPNWRAISLIGARGADTVANCEELSSDVLRVALHSSHGL